MGVGVGDGSGIAMGEGVRVGAGVGVGAGGVGVGKGSAGGAGVADAGGAGDADGVGVAVSAGMAGAVGVSLEAEAGVGNGDGLDGGLAVVDGDGVGVGVADPAMAVARRAPTRISIAAGRKGSGVCGREWVLELDFLPVGPPPAARPAPLPPPLDHNRRSARRPRRHRPGPGLMPTLYARGPGNCCGYQAQSSRRPSDGQPDAPFRDHLFAGLETGLSRPPAKGG